VRILRPRLLDDRWTLPGLEEPPPPLANGVGTTYIVAAGLSDKAGAAPIKAGGSASLAGHLPTELPADYREGLRAGYVAVPVLTLDESLPPWAHGIFFLKVDTQGWEERVLRGAARALAGRRFKYVQFEFSPLLMKRAASGNPQRLLRLLPSYGGLCFDMMGEHMALAHTPRAGSHSSLDAYYKALDSGNYSTVKRAKLKMYGPWEDIMCFFPDAPV